MAKKDKKETRKDADNQKFLYWSWRPVHVLCFLSLLIFTFVPAVIIVDFAENLLRIRSNEKQPPPGWTSLETAAVALLSVTLSHTLLYLIRRAKMRDLQEYEADPYVPYLYAAVCACLLVLYAMGILGVHYISTSTLPGAIGNHVLNMIGLFFLSGPAFTGLLVLLINFAAWILRLAFGRDIIPLKRKFQRKRRSD